ncbi:MAG: 4-hydroxy-tetrahydrodipicolinate reductase [Candidatus Omnitrophica bacterium]|nr:4-hydroxy-tetrahydrodipicolinate reductase [Candidatus Omnitrophota bacterium]
MIKLAVSGCCGKMGRRIVALAGADKAVQLVGALEQPGHPAIGKKLSDVLVIPGFDFNVVSNPEILKDADVLIEFTNPATTVEHLISAVKYKKTMVIGTTGLELPQLEKIKQASTKIPILFSPNMSLGVNLVFRLVKELAEKLTREYQVDITEVHHVHKLDAPSGTAKRLMEIIKEMPEWENEHIKIDSIREGEIVGDHQVHFSSPGDSIIIKHSAKTRNIFAQGALIAAKFIIQQKPGLYDMQDVIG